MKVHFTSTDFKLIKLLLIFYIIRYSVHIIVFYYKKNNLLIQDLNNELQQYGLSNFSSKNTLLKNLYLLCWAFSNNPFYLTLFYYRVRKVRLLLSVLKKDNSSFYIYSKSIGNNIKLYHPFSTIVNCKSIGNNFIIRNNTTIGNIYDDNSLCPTIGNNVNIGSNVCIIGNITIGNNVTIGAGTVVNKNIPDNSIVVGNPFRIIKK